MDGRSWALPVTLLLLGSAGVAGCKRTRPPPPTPIERPSGSATSSVPAPEVPLAHVDNVVLITVDALRGDQPWTGSGQVSTPNLARLARESIVYTRAYSLANLTTASIAGMLASRYPCELPRDMCTLGRFDLAGSLAPTLKSASIHTFAAQGHAIFAGSTAPKLGFDEWQLVRGSAGRLQKAGAVTGNDIGDLLIGYLERSPPKQKRFAWSHLVDPHHVYVGHSAHPPVARDERSRYDSEVAYTDAVIGRVLQSIERRGMAQQTAIVFTSDHGEAFGEHGLTEHGFSVYEEEIHVPLMLRIPGVAPKRIDVLRSVIDVAPTIVELYGLTPPSSWRGTSLARDLSAGAPASRPVMVDVPEMQGRLPLRAVIEGKGKVVFTGTAGRVYDLTNDPDERVPVSGEARERALARARQALDRIQCVQGSPCAQGAPSGAERDEP